MKRLLKKFSIIFVSLAMCVAGLFGCDFFSSPKAEVTIVADNNRYATVTGLSTLLDNVYAKMSVVQAFEIEGNISETATITASFIAEDKLKDSCLTLEYVEKDQYTLKFNIRNKLLYFKVPFEAMGINTTLNLGMKDNIDDFIEYLPLFARALDIEVVRDLNENDYREFFNHIDYIDILLDWVLDGEKTYAYTSGSYSIYVDDQIEVVLNRDFSIRRINSLVNEECYIKFIYPKVGVYTLEYPGEIVGIGYVTRESIEDSLGGTFQTLLGN